MSRILALAGFAGSGKTVATEYFAEKYGGKRVYVGEHVMQVMRSRGLPETRENERLVRIELRKHDRAAIMRLAIAQIKELSDKDACVIVDAVFTPEEYICLKDLQAGTLVTLLGVHSAFETRCARLSARHSRPFSAADLRKRDETEINELGISEVLSRAHSVIQNDCSLTEYEMRLSSFYETSIALHRP